MVIADEPSDFYRLGAVARVAEAAGSRRPTGDCRLGQRPAGRQTLSCAFTTSNRHPGQPYLRLTLSRAKEQSSALFFENACCKLAAKIPSILVLESS